MEGGATPPPPPARLMHPPPHACCSPYPPPAPPPSPPPPPDPPSPPPPSPPPTPPPPPSPPLPPPPSPPNPPPAPPPPPFHKCVCVWDLGGLVLLLCGVRSASRPGRTCLSLHLSHCLQRPHPAHFHHAHSTGPPLGLVRQPHPPGHQNGGERQLRPHRHTWLVVVRHQRGWGHSQQHPVQLCSRGERGVRRAVCWRSSPSPATSRHTHLLACSRQTD